MHINVHEDPPPRYLSQVCGAPGNAPCTDSPCGGAGCRDDEGKRHCGGLNCNGAVAMADSALEKSLHAEKELGKAMGEVEGLFSKVRSRRTTSQNIPHRTTTQNHHIEPPHRTITQNHHTEPPHRTTTQNHHTEPSHRTTTQDQGVSRQQQLPVYVARWRRLS